jgi:hypothetical protein
MSSRGPGRQILGFILVPAVLGAAMLAHAAYAQVSSSTRFDPFNPGLTLSSDEGTGGQSTTAGTSTTLLNPPRDGGATQHGGSLPGVPVFHPSRLETRSPYRP